MLPSGWDSAGGITPPASSSSSVADSCFPSPSVDFGFFHCLMSALSRPYRDQSDHAYINSISPAEVLGALSVFGRPSVMLSCFCPLMGVVCVFCRGRYFVMSVYSWWLGSVILSSGLLCCSLAYLHFYHLKWVEYYFLILVVISNVIDVYGMCVSGCVQLSEGGRARGAGGWESGALHLDRTHRVPRALLEVRCLQWEAEEWGGTVRHKTVCGWGIIQYVYLLFITDIFI